MTVLIGVYYLLFNLFIIFDIVMILVNAELELTDNYWNVLIDYDTDDSIKATVRKYGLFLSVIILLSRNIISDI